jgi:hypothetical protein
MGSGTPTETFRAASNGESSMSNQRSREAYAREKLLQAVNALATLPGTVQERLAEAARHIILVRPDDIQDEALRRTFIGIHDDLSFQFAVGSEGRINATMRITDDQDAEKIARRILDLGRDLAERYYRRLERECIERGET